MNPHLFRFLLNPSRDENNQQHLHALRTRFEMQFELYFLLFLASQIDGSAGPQERLFIEGLLREIGVSSFERKTLQSRVDQLPDYSFDLLIQLRKKPELSALAARVTYGLLKIDGPLNNQESIFLESLADALGRGAYLSPEVRRNIDARIEGRTPESQSPDYHLPESENHTSEESQRSTEDLLKELDELIGLESVKEEVKRLVSFLEIQQKRKQQKLNEAGFALHMVLSGNPGTGKTTVARLLAKIYRSLGVLNKGHLVETDRTGLVGQYVGHTEKKTNEVIDDALDGVLFIDEAYSLNRASSGNDYGREAIDVVVKRMEDDRKRLIVIVAGYTDEMKDFISSNPGLQSRFNTRLHFPDFSVDELTDLFELIAKKQDYILSDPAKTKLKDHFGQKLSQKTRSFGNGRYVRNIFEKMIRNQAFRLSAQTGDLKREELMTLLDRDIDL